MLRTTIIARLAVALGCLAAIAAVDWSTPTLCALIALYLLTGDSLSRHWWHHK